MHATKDGTVHPVKQAKSANLAVRPMKLKVKKRLSLTPGGTLFAIVLIICGIYVGHAVADPSSSKLEDREKGPLLAIKIGNIFTRAGVYRDGKFETIKSENGKSYFPTIVAFPENKGELVGWEAQRHGSGFCNKDHGDCDTIYGITKFMERDFDDEVVQKASSEQQVSVVSKYNLPYFSLHDGNLLLSSTDVCAAIIRKVMSNAEKQLGEKIVRAMFVVPRAEKSAFEDMGDAAEAAGLKWYSYMDASIGVLKGLGFWNRQIPSKSRNFLVVDIGGETMDLAMWSVNSPMKWPWPIGGKLSTGAGTEFTASLSEYLRNLYHQKFSDSSEYQDDLSRLAEESERAQIELSTSRRAQVLIGYGPSGKRVVGRVTRDWFESVNEEKFSNIMDRIDTFMADQKDIDVEKVVLVGGSANIPKIQKLLRARFRDKFYNPLEDSVKPEEASLMGAAIWETLYESAPNSEASTDSVSHSMSNDQSLPDSESSTHSVSHSMGHDASDL